MSRSSGPQGQPSYRPLPAGSAQDHDPRTRTLGGRPGQPQAPHDPQAYQQPYPPQGAAPAHDPYAQGHQDFGYGRSPDPTFTQQGYGYTAGIGQAATASNQQQQPGYGTRGPAYEPWPPQPMTDARGYDLSSYQHATTEGQQGYAPYPQQMPAADWHANEHFGQATMDPTLDPNGYAGMAQHQGGALEQAYVEDEAAYEDEEPPRRSAVKIAAVLALAIAVGGGGMYVYNTLLGAPSGGSDTPLVKNAAGPSKVKPTDPGGLKFGHADSKIMGRLGEDGGPAEGDAGPRKVSTLIVNPDGSIAPPAAAAEASAAGPPPQVTAQPAPAGVPGLSIVDVDGTKTAAPAAAAPAAAAPAPAPAAEAPAPAKPEKPVIISKVQPAADPPPAAAAPVKPAAAAASPKPPAEKKVAAAAPATTGATGPKPTGAGYVAVLASVPATGSSQLDALKQFADLKTKYGTLLANKTPEVQVANLGEKGTYHRLLVGPPGSQESVRELCNGLKAAGYSGCWPLAY